VFGERDPMGYADSPSPYISFQASAPNFLDPFGLKITTQGRGKAKEDGTTVRFADAGPVWDDYWAFLNKHANEDRIKGILQKILRLQASSIEYRIRVLAHRSKQGEGGFTKAISDTVIGVNVLSHAQFSKRVRLAHELEHAYQFETGRLAYWNYAGKWYPFLYDMQDEVDAYDVGWAVYRAAPTPTDVLAAGGMLVHYPATGSMAEKISYLRAHGYGHQRKSGPSTVADLPSTVPTGPGYHSAPYPPSSNNRIIYIVPGAN